MAEKIVISFDDEETEKPQKPEDKIIIEIKPAEKPDKSKEIKNSTLNFQYRGNTHLAGLDESPLTYPAGLENGFGKIFSVSLKDNFLNSILLTNKFIILSSSGGSIYFVDRFRGELVSRCIIENEAFEKTGIVIKNKVYINSVKSIYSYDDSLNEKKIYESAGGYYIWAHLNKSGKQIIFLEYSPELKIAVPVVFNPESGEYKKCREINIRHYISDALITCEGFAYILHDNVILKTDLKDYSSVSYQLNFDISPDSNFLLSDGKIYFNNGNNELFYFDIKNEDIKFTGIKCGYINSLASVGDNIFIGLISGWQLFKASGMPVYTYDDITENRIESLNRHILAVSKENKIIFHNLDKFQEAEGFSLTTGGMESDKIISARIGEDAVFVLSKNGILEAFNNDKLNIVI
ncbi:MAG: hypothetical protein HY959_07340 [Ignavibacteriae bacterium]|nr:hypothetical protein [Ignavibacteriota bacterium]